MSRRCDCGCKRPAVTEFMHPTFGVFWFGHLCTIRNRPALEQQGFMEFSQLDDTADEAPKLTLTGGMDADVD